MSQPTSVAGPIDLVDRARDGDSLAGEELCRLLYPSLEKWLYGMVRERHHDVKAELVLDILQETWLQIQRKLSQFKGDTEGALMAWCYRVAFATSTNYLKKYVRVRRREESTDAVPEPGDCPTPTPRQTLIREEKLSQVREAVMAIKNKKHREAVVLFFFDELSQKEIAEMMGATESAVSTWVYRGKADVEEYLRQKGFAL